MVILILVEFVVSPIKPQYQTLFHFTTTSTLLPIIRPFTLEELLEEAKTPLQSQVVVPPTTSFQVIPHFLFFVMLVMFLFFILFFLILSFLFSYGFFYFFFYFKNNQTFELFFFFFCRRCEWSINLRIYHLKH